MVSALPFSVGDKPQFVVLSNVFKQLPTNPTQPEGFIVKVSPGKFVVLTSQGVCGELILNSDGTYTHMNSDCTTSRVDSLVKFIELSNYVLAVDFAVSTLFIDPYHAVRSDVTFGHEQVSLILCGTDISPRTYCSVVFIGPSHLVPRPVLQQDAAFADAPGICCAAKFLQAAYQSNESFQLHVNAWKI